MGWTVLAGKSWEPDNLITKKMAVQITKTNVKIIIKNRSRIWMQSLFELKVVLVAFVPSIELQNTKIEK